MLLTLEAGHQSQEVSLNGPTLVPWGSVNSWAFLTLAVHSNPWSYSNSNNQSSQPFTTKSIKRSGINKLLVINSIK